jgi:hypothetical protein
MRKLTLILVLLLAVASLAAAERSLLQLNGNDWRSWTDPEKSQYLMGFFAGLAAYSWQAIYDGFPQADCEKLMRYVSNYGSLIQRIDDFYLNPANRSIYLFAAAYRMGEEA